MCTRNRYELLTVESDINNSVEPEQKQENSVINITQTVQSPQDQSQFNDCAGEQSPSDINSTDEPEQKRENSVINITQTSQSPPDQSQSNDCAGNQNTDNLRGHTSQSGQTTHQSVVLIGDSVIKSIVPQKLSRKKVHKFTYPGKTAEEIDREIRNKGSNIEASHVIVHCGTNNLTTDSANVCARKIEQLCMTARKIFPNAQIGVSSITERNDIPVHDKIRDVNSAIKEMCVTNNYSFIHHDNIDESCLNNSKLHLNAKGSALLAVDFINFLRGRKRLSHINQPKNFWLEETLRQLGTVLAMARRRTR